MYKLIATDMDGTLLNSNSHISKQNEDAIINAQEKGVIFVLASGRPTPAMIPFVSQLKLDKLNGYLISYNGAAITRCSDNKNIFSLGLNEEDIRLWWDIANKYDVSIVTYVDDIIYCSKHTEYVDIEAKVTGLEVKEIEDIKELDFTKTMKCMLVAKPSKIKDLYETTKKTLGDKYFIAISNPHFLEVANINVNKGQTLEHLCNLLNIKKDEVIACGDSYNDVDMLKIAGLSVAADNSPSDIKDICKYVSVHHDSHILEDIIKKYI